MVLHGRGGELERDDAFGVVRQCLEPALRGLSGPDREGLLVGAAGLAAPAVLDVATSPEAAPPVGVLHGLYWMVAGLSLRAPVLLAIDDLQWADEASMRFLSYLVRRLESVAVAVVLASRPDDVVDAPSLLDDVRGDPLARVLHPRPLGEGDVLAFLRGVCGGDVDREFARACARASGGNPFLLGELARTLREEDVPFTAVGVGRVVEITPPLVARSVRARLARLSASARSLAQAVAVLGDDTPIELAGALTEVDVGAEAARELTRAGILDDVTPLRFRHPILRSAVLGSLDALDLDRAHAAAATLLRARGSSAERVSMHLLPMSPAGRPEVVDDLLAAAGHARARGAPAAAATLLRRALAEPVEPSQRPEVLLELAQMELVAAGSSGIALEHLEAAYLEARDPVIRARAILSVGHPGDGGLAAFRPRIAPTLEALGDSEPELARRLQAVALVAYGLGPDLDARLLEGRELSGETPGEAIILAYHAFIRMRPEATATDIAALAERAAHHAGAFGDDGTASFAFDAVALTLRWTDRLDLAERLLDDAITRAQRRGSQPDFARASAHRAAVLRRRGRLRDAEADARAGMTSGDPATPWTTVFAAQPLILCQLDAGRLGDAESSLAEVGAEQNIPDLPPLTAMLLARMRVHAERGDPARALEDFAEARRRRERIGGETAAWIEDYLYAAELHDAVADRQAALALAANTLTLARQWNTPAAIGQALRTHARLAATSDVIDTLQEATALLEHSPARLEYARALVDLGGALRRDGHRRDARAPLRAGYELALECGADALTQHARSELAASGIRLRRAALSGADALTPSERRIADLAAAGASNLEIAQALFVTVKTVETHLTHIYRKLDITKRSALPQALTSATAPPD